MSMSPTDIETSLDEPRFGNCENCRYHTTLKNTKGFAGAFLGNPVYDDLWFCQLCIDTMDIRRGMEKDKTTKLILYLANEILDHVRKNYRGPSY